MPAGILNDLTGPDGFQSFGSLPFDGKTLWCGTGLAAFLVAAAAAFLLSDEAEWITGQVYGVDGGMVVR